MIEKTKEREEAIQLRKQGFSYREILEKIPVAKSTLSLWLRGVGLSKRQKQRLTEKKLAGMKRGWIKVHQLRMERWKQIKKEAASKIKNLTTKEFWLIGIALYWAEGTKEKEYRGSTDLKFSNSDFLMILLFRKWVTQFFKIPAEKLRYELYIHEKANWGNATEYWATKLSISANQIQVYFKHHNTKPKRKNTGKEYHGQLRIHVKGSVEIVRKIDGWIEGICKIAG